MLGVYELGAGASRLSSIPTQLVVLCYTLLSTKYNADINLTNNGYEEQKTRIG